MKMRVATSAAVLPGFVNYSSAATLRSDNRILLSLSILPTPMFHAQPYRNPCGNLPTNHAVVSSSNP